jgi:hypothetical protein
MNPTLARQRIRKALSRGGSTLIVHWVKTQGGDPDPITAAVVGAVETPLSGTLKAFRHQESAMAKLRQFQEIQAGDLLVDVLPEAAVTLYPGQLQSGTVALDALAECGVRFESNGVFYTQAEVGERLAQAWNVIFQDVELVRTVLLRKAT